MRETLADQLHSTEDATDVNLEVLKMKIKSTYYVVIVSFPNTLRPGANAIKKFTPSLGIPYLGV